MGYEQVLRLPIKTFWLMADNIDRVEARKDMRALTVAQVSQATPEGVQQLREALVIEAGTIVKLDETPEDPRNAKRDDDAIAVLKQLAG
jgi:hypothetical protein